jgi:predicted GNAT family N-acyltransferase
MIMTFREIAFGSADYGRECQLRNEVLRKPIGLSFPDEEIGSERTHLHFGQFDERENLVACVIAVPLSLTEAKIRQMAVSSEHQGKGHGRSILHCLEDYLVRQGTTQLYLHARMTAVKFYEKMGYAKSGDEFVEVGIVHVRMEKDISRFRRTSPTSIKSTQSHAASFEVPPL